MKKIILVGTITGAIILSSIFPAFASEDKNERWSKILLLKEEAQNHKVEVQLSRNEINTLRSERKVVTEKIVSLRSENFNEVKTQITALNNQIIELIKKMQAGQITKEDFKVQLKDLRSQKSVLQESIKPVKNQIVPMKEERKDIHDNIQLKRTDQKDKNVQFKSDMKQKRDELKGNN